MRPAAMSVNCDDDIKIGSNGDGAVRLRQRDKEIVEHGSSSRSKTPVVRASEVDGAEVWKTEENIPIEEVLKNLRCGREGLSSEAAEERLTIFGHNKLEEKKESKFLKFLGFIWNPLSWVMEAAAIMAIALANGGGKAPDWQDFVGIITLLLINSTISFNEENNAGNAAAALMARLAPKAKVLQDGRWNEQDAAVLVPGDIISIKLGDIIPADARLLEGDPLK